MRCVAENGAVPDGWQQVRLREVLELEQPGAWGEDPTPSDTGVRVLRAADLTRDGRVNPSNAAWRRLSKRDMERRLMRDGDLILERSGGGPGTPVGRVALVEGFGAVYCNNFCQQLRVDEKICTPKYAARALWHRYTQGVTGRLEHQTTGIRNLDYAAYLNLPILLPPLPEQRAIAAVLDSIDDAIEGAEAVIAATGQLRDSLLHDLLTRGLPGQHTEWRDVPGLGTIPADWEVVRLGDVAEVTSGLAMGPHRIPQTNPRPYLTVANVQADQVTIDENRLMEVSESEYQSRTLQAGDVVLVEGHAQISQLGRAAIVPSEAEGFTFQNHLFRVRMGELCNARFATAYVNGHGGRRYFGSFGGTTSGLNTVSAANVKALPIPLPPPAEQQTIAATLDGVDSALEVARQELAGLRLLKESTADALLTGRVHFKQKD